MDLKAHLKSLVEAHGPSGHEDAIREIVKEAWEPLVDAFQQDGIGSLIGVKRATQPTETPRRILLAAHMDEIGMMVREIIDGFIAVHRVSGVDNRVMPAQTVTVHGREPLTGVVATKPPHLLSADERKTYLGFDDLLVDVGLPPEEVERLVEPGDLITADVPMVELGTNKLVGKAMDDRACVATITLCLDMLQGMHHRWDVYAAATVQEEVGLRGAATAAHLAQPDVAIALDVTFGAQPGIPTDTAADINGGPDIGMGPNFHPKLFDALVATAKTQEIKYQQSVITGRSGTDAWAIQVAREGIPTALLSVPIRNMHSPVETVDTRDIERTARLMAHFIAGLTDDFLTTISWMPTANGSSDSTAKDGA